MFFTSAYRNINELCHNVMTINLYFVVLVYITNTNIDDNK